MINEQKKCSPMMSPVIEAPQFTFDDDQEIEQPEETEQFDDVLEIEVRPHVLMSPNFAASEEFLKLFGFKPESGENKK